MEHSSTSSHSFAFHGDGGTLFKHFLVNTLLTIVTLGIYYPWARAKMERYLYGETEFAGTPFQYHGTGKELFVGFVKTVLGFWALLGLTGLISYLTTPIVGAIVLYVTILGIIPFAIVDSLKYTCSRSSWKGIHFSFEGEVGNMVKVLVPGLLLTLITLGLYYPWFLVAYEREVKNNIRFGRNVSFNFEGDGSELFWMVLKGYLLSLVTLGFYSFWLSADLYNYSYNQTSIHQGQRTAYFYSNITGGYLLKMFFITLFGTVFSLGLALPWLIVMNNRELAAELSIEGELDFHTIQANTPEYVSATGEAVLESLS